MKCLKQGAKEDIKEVGAIIFTIISISFISFCLGYMV